MVVVDINFASFFSNLLQFFQSHIIRTQNFSFKSNIQEDLSCFKNVLFLFHYYKIMGGPNLRPLPNFFPPSLYFHIIMTGSKVQIKQMQNDFHGHQSNVWKECHLDTWKVELKLMNLFWFIHVSLVKHFHLRCNVKINFKFLNCKVTLNEREREWVKIQKHF